MRPGAYYGTGMLPMQPNNIWNHLCQKVYIHYDSYLGQILFKPSTCFKNYIFKFTIPPRTKLHNLHDIGNNLEPSLNEI